MIDAQSSSKIKSFSVRFPHFWDRESRQVFSSSLFPWQNSKAKGANQKIPFKKVLMNYRKLVFYWLIIYLNITSNFQKG